MKRLFISLFMIFVALSPLPAHAAGGAYLALGDSVPFGSNPLLSVSNASSFSGYPDIVAQRLGLSETDASCPGEPTGHFISSNSNGWICGAYRLFYPLHTWYLGSQLDFANFWLFFNAGQTQLITLDIGVNDYWILSANCWGNRTCVEQGLAQTVSTMKSNLDVILKQLRKDGYHGRLVMFNHYLPDPTDAAMTADLASINAAIASEAQISGVELADAYGAFMAASGENPCAAGLLIVTSTSPLKCDVHPSAAGHRVLAALVTSGGGAVTSQTVAPTSVAPSSPPTVAAGPARLNSNSALPALASTSPTPADTVGSVQQPKGSSTPATVFTLTPTQTAGTSATQSRGSSPAASASSSPTIAATPSKVAG